MEQSIYKQNIIVCLSSSSKIETEILYCQFINDVQKPCLWNWLWRVYLLLLLLLLSNPQSFDFAGYKVTPFWKGDNSLKKNMCKTTLIYNGSIMFLSGFEKHYFFFVSFLNFYVSFLGPWFFSFFKPWSLRNILEYSAVF
jgi:hypothetical protein